MPRFISDMVDVLYSDIFGISLIAIAILFLFGLGEFLRLKTTLSSEWTRKSSHFGAGLIILTFPWILSSSISVFVLTTSFGLILFTAKKYDRLKSIHDIDRQTSGAFYYPLSVFVIYWMSKGDPVMFCLPITILALSDAGAALVGKQYGTNRFRVMDGYRSFEGSLTFFGLSLTILLVGFAIAKIPGWPEMLLIAITVSVLTTAIEAISIRGLDNLLIPCSAYLMLERSLRIGLAELSSWFEGMLLSLLTILITHRISKLTTAGSISIFVAGSMAYAIGSWPWFIPLLSLYIAYTSTNPKERSIRTDMVVVFPTILGALCFILLFGHYQDPNLYLGYLSTLCSGGAISMRMMAKRLNYPSVPFILTGALAPLIPLLAVPLPNVQTLYLGMSVVSAIIAFQILSRTPFVGRRLLATLLGGALAWAFANTQSLKLF